jgi:predicted ATP-grasp superfamily ATP-dependent carboligase
MRTIVITGAGGPAGRALIEQLAGRRIDGEDVVLIGADMAPLADSRLSLTARVPAADDPMYTPAMRHLIGAVRADLVIPTVSEELSTMAALGELLGEEPLRDLPGASCGHGRTASADGPLVVVGAPGPVMIAADKLHTMWALDAAGVSVPAYAPASTFERAGDAIAAMGGPVVVKPRVSRGGRGVRLIEDAADLDWASLPPGQIVQSFAPGVEYCPQVYRSWETGQTSVVVLEKTALREGRVGNAAAVRRCSPEEAPDIVHLATRAVDALGLTGPVDLDIRRDVHGMPVVLEVNARFGANSAAAPELLSLVLDDVSGVERRVAELRRVLA